MSKKTCVRPCSAGLPLRRALVMLLALCGTGWTFGTALASVTIDFSAFPDGTPVTANNPYAGLLDLQASGGTEWVDSGSGSGILWSESTVANGALAVVPTGEVPPGTPPVWYYGRLTASFSAPVVAVSFAAWCSRTAGYSYSGVDALGDPFGGSGRIPGYIDGSPPPPGPGYWVTFTPTIPEGGYLTGFQINNGDPKLDDASFWVNDIMFTPVPEPSTLALGALPVILVLWRRRNA